MAIQSTEVLPDNTLEEFRIEFNKLITDVSGLSLANTFDTQIIFEGATDDTFETALSVTDPTADRNIIFPDQSGNVLLDSANINLVDNIELQFGTGGDLKIYHDGSHSYIEDAGTGNLKIQGSQVDIIGSGETMATFVDDGAVTLYHNNVAIVATAATGISVTGDVTATDDLILDNDGALIQFGDDQDVTLTHVHDTGLLLNTTMVIQFRDSAINIGSPTDGDLDINADDEIELNSTLVDCNANLDVSGTYTGAGLMTTGGNIVIPNGGTIGGAGDTDLLTLTSGVLTVAGEVVGTGFTGTLDGILGSGTPAAASVTTLTATGDVTMTGKSVNAAVHTEAAHATTSDIWTGGNTCLLSGSAVTFTDVADAPQAGAVREVIANAAHVITDNAALEVDGNANYTCAVGDLLRFEAKTTSTFRVSVVAHGDGGGSGDAKTANPLSQFAATTSAQLAGVISNETGSGLLVFNDSPTLITPALGTPASGVGTNITGTAASLTAGNVTTNANLTGHITSTGNAAILGSFTSAQLATALTNETGSGVAVFSTSPTLVTPVLGTPASGNLANCTFPTLNQSTSGNAATVTTNANLTGHITSTGNAAVLGSFTSAQLATALTNETGSGAAVFGTAPTLVGLTATGDITMTAKSVNGAVHTEAAHATTSDIWSGGNTCLLSGSVVTFTDVADAPQAGAIRYVVSNAAHIFTDNSALEVDGNENYTCAANDVLMITAKTTSTFRVSVIAHGDNATGGGGGGDSGLNPNSATVADDYTLADGYNAISAGPITIATGKTVTIPTASRWVII